MRNLITTLVSFALLSIFGASSAFAGTEAFNSYKTTNEHGYRNTTINVDIDSSEYSVVDSQTIKIEADKGTTNIVNVSFDGDKFTGTGHSSNQVAVDPVVIGTYTSEYSTKTTNEAVSIDTEEYAKFNSHDYTHTVGSTTY